MVVTVVTVLLSVWVLALEHDADALDPPVRPQSRPRVRFHRRPPTPATPCANYNKHEQSFFFFLSFGGHKSFFGVTGTPVLDFW